MDICTETILRNQVRKPALKMQLEFCHERGLEFCHERGIYKYDESTSNVWLMYY